MPRSSSGLNGMSAPSGGVDAAHAPLSDGSTDETRLADSPRQGEQSLRRGGFPRRPIGQRAGMRRSHRTLAVCGCALALTVGTGACGSDDSSTSGNTTTTLCAERSTSQPQTGTSDSTPDGPGGTTPAGVGSASTSTTSPAAQSRSGVAANASGAIAEEEPSTTPSSGVSTTSSTGTGTTSTTAQAKGSGERDCSDYSTTDDGGTGTGG